ncbi:hypothetical protein CCACVL1_09157, partial [Corchorus capsularis]
VGCRHGDGNQNRPEKLDFALINLDPTRLGHLVMVGEFTNGSSCICKVSNLRPT